ncbi:MAG TPA: DEAD/DEAH box helicase, partial [Chondromyces sp.]|nr:DEAD/DEAH box helicase [Chondromyces sp.]
MSKLTESYIRAVEHTKQKVYEDILRYLGDKDSLPSFEDYLSDRKHYIDQLWINVWLNKVTNDVPKKEKRAFLRERGFVTEGVDKKLINKLFRNEMREYQPFYVIAWLEEEVGQDQAEWELFYEKAKEEFRRVEEDRLRQARQESISRKAEQAAQTIIEEQQERFYLSVRHFIASLLKEDFESGERYYKVDTFELEEKLKIAGNFNPEDYSTVSEFFDELTGNIHQTIHWDGRYFEYETYYYPYAREMMEYLYDLAAETIKSQLPQQIIEEYREAYGSALTVEPIRDMIDIQLSKMGETFLEEIEEEYVSDLLQLADFPFDFELHQQIYKRDISTREQRKAQELAELERRKEEEARILNDIFGAEYSPSLEKNIRYVLHIGETNTGKTHHALKRMKQAESGLYLAPLRLLALEVYDKLNHEGVPCSLKTGEEEKINRGADHIACTVEMFHEKDFYEVVVIDEAQMIADQDRGFSWYKAITKANAKEVHIIGSRNIKKMLLQILGEAEYELNEYTRDIPLEVESKEFHLSQTNKGDALVCFSRRDVLETASKLRRNKHKVSMIYGSMPPETRRKQMQLFVEGETNVIVSTDAIGMGLNLPIRRIVFLKNEKFDGTRRRRLTSQEIKQIAGRAGRKGIYPVGKVAFTSDIETMKKLLEKEDEPVRTFAIAPTSAVFERFQRHYRHLGTFFELWDRFESPKGTEKSTLFQERELYELIKGTEIEARFSMMDLYGFLHLPFSEKEPALVEQWLRTMEAIAYGME